MKSFIKIILIVLVIAIICFTIFLIYDAFKVDYQKAKRQFENDQEDLRIVANYMLSFDFESMRFDSEDSSLKAYVYELDSNQLCEKIIIIHDTNVLESIQRLQEKKYSVFTKDRNVIDFTKWSRYEFGAGFVYSPDLINEDSIQFCTMLQPLSQDDWYYYECDYNAWRKQ